MRRDGVDEPAAEARSVAAKLDGEKVGTRVEADDELRLLALDLGGKPVGEGLHGHGHRLKGNRNDGGRLPRPPSVRSFARGSRA